jgi:hypothetical protein
MARVDIISGAITTPCTVGEPAVEAAHDPVT